MNKCRLQCVWFLLLVRTFWTAIIFQITSPTNLSEFLPFPLFASVCHSSICLFRFLLVCLSDCLLECLTVCLVFCLSDWLSLCLSDCLPVYCLVCWSFRSIFKGFIFILSLAEKLVCPYICLSAYLYVHRTSVCLSICLTDSPSVCLSVCLSVVPSVAHLIVRPPCRPPIFMSIVHLSIYPPF